jgi:hypothetical protein
MAMRAPVAALFLLVILGAFMPLSAQEVQVALDEGGRVYEVDRALASRLGLFLDDYPQLQMVRLYRVDAERYVLEVTGQRAGETVRERVPLTASEVGSLRARVSQALAVRAPEVVLDQDGRFLLLGTTTLLGVGFYGWAVPVILDLDDGRATLATYMFTAGASFVAPFLYTRNRPVTYGMANAGFWGATRGIGLGTGLLTLIDPNASSRAYTAAAFAGSVGGGLAMYTWALQTDMSAGDAHVIGNHGDFGSAWALATMLMTQADDDRVTAAMWLAGSGAGLAVGASRAERLPYTWGDAEIQRGAFYLGMYNGLALWSIIAGDEVSTGEERILGAALLAGSTGGLILADRFLLPGHDFSAGQGILVNLGTVAGGLLGLGTAVLIAPDDPDSPAIFFTLSALGANLGFGLTYLALADDARQGGETRRGSLELDFNPAALLGLGGGTTGLGLPAGSRLPLIAGRYRF